MQTLPWKVSGNLLAERQPNQHSAPTSKPCEPITKHWHKVCVDNKKREKWSVCVIPHNVWHIQGRLLVFVTSLKTLTSEQLLSDCKTSFKLQGSQSLLISSPSCWSVKCFHFCFSHSSSFQVPAGNTYGNLFWVHISTHQCTCFTPSCSLESVGAELGH